MGEHQCFPLSLSLSFFGSEKNRPLNFLKIQAVSSGEVIFAGAVKREVERDVEREVERRNHARGIHARDIHLH
jgi:hypothetical protein